MPIKILSGAATLERLGMNGVKRELKTSRRNTFIFVLIRTRLNKKVTYNIIIIISITLGLGSLTTHILYDNNNSNVGYAEV